MRDRRVAEKAAVERSTDEARLTTGKDVGSPYSFDHRHGNQLTCSTAHANQRIETVMAEPFLVGYPPDAGVPAMNSATTVTLALTDCDMKQRGSTSSIACRASGTWAASATVHRGRMTTCVN